MIGRSKTIVTVVAALWTVAAHGEVRYVAPSGAADCSTWANACSLASALEIAVGGDDIWVKAGTYVKAGYPADPGTIELQNGVRMIGGFAGTETLASQSNPVNNVTILDGGGTIQVVNAANCAGSTLLRGFTIQNGLDTSDAGGGGLVLTDSSMLVVQCVFQSNLATRFGGAVAVRGASASQFANCVFKNNGSGSGTSVQPLGGGAVFLHKGTAVFTNCLFHDNKAGEGGAILMASGVPDIRDCTFAENKATIGSGGAIFDQSGKALIRNSVLWGNTAVRGGAQIFNYPATTPTAVTYCDVEGGWSGTGNINANPQFVDAAGGDFKLSACSPCKNVGNNADLPLDVADVDWDGNTGETLPKDLALGNRKAGGMSPIVDMGAYEGLTTCEE